MTQELPKGYACTKCGKWHKHPGYVYAHWREVLMHTCDCGQKHSLLRGVVTPTK